MSMQFRGSLIQQCSFSALILCAALVSGCGAAADSPGTTEEGGATSSAGSSGSVGLAGSATAGAASSFGGAAGSTGGQEFGGSSQTAGAGGVAGGSAGAFTGGGTGGAAAGSGSGGSGGATAGGGGMSGHGGTGGSGGSGGGAAPTWTQLYTQFFDNPQYASNCTGSKCHNPGTQKSISFSTQAKGYTSVKATLSKVTSVLSSGTMPEGRPKMPAADLAMFKAWVAAGALNN